jgi:hypothetical protein
MEDRLLKERRLFIRALKGDLIALSKIEDQYRRPLLKAAKKTLIDQFDAEWIVDIIFNELENTKYTLDNYFDPEQSVPLYFDLGEYLMKKLLEEAIVYNSCKEKPIDKAALKYLKKCYPHADLNN